MKIQSKQLSIILLIAFTLIFTTSCEKEKDQEAPKITDIEGSWSGITSQGENISFTVSNDSVGGFTMNVLIPNGSSELTFLSTFLITNYSFTIQYSMFNGVSIWGTFKSNTESEGTFEHDGISGTWTAAKQ